MSAFFTHLDVLSLIFNRKKALGFPLETLGTTSSTSWGCESFRSTHRTSRAHPRALHGCNWSPLQKWAPVRSLQELCWSLNHFPTTSSTCLSADLCLWQGCNLCLGPWKVSGTYNTNNEHLQQGLQKHCSLSYFILLGSALPTAELLQSLDFHFWSLQQWFVPYELSSATSCVFTRSHWHFSGNVLCSASLSQLRNVSLFAGQCSHGKQDCQLW